MDTEIPVTPDIVETQPASPTHHHHHHLPPQMPSPTGITPDQRGKLQSELDIVQSNMNILGEMLSELKPGSEQPDELELLQVTFHIFLLFLIVFYLGITCDMSKYARTSCRTHQ